MFMSRKYILRLCLPFFVLVATTNIIFAGDRPNIVILLADDLGYSDVGCFGAEGFSTPNLDRMADEGIRLNNFYVHPICTPTRAALLSGCYPQRVGLELVSTPRRKTGIHPDEELLPELLNQAGYATGIFGKWHLGHHPDFWPLNNGFDEWQGTPGSNDHRNIVPDELSDVSGVQEGLVFIENDTIVEVVEDQSYLTQRSTAGAVDFIQRHQNEPFFLYVPYNMPHTPLAVGENFLGTSKRGLYGDVVSELDWSVGEILSSIQECGLDDDTLVIFTSDNGPWLIFGDHGGSATPFRGGKKQTLEGGVRVPFIARWPGRITAGATSDSLIAVMDLLPTIVGLCDAPIPTRKIDGIDFKSILLGEMESNEVRKSYLYYYRDRLQAVRCGDWKLQLAASDEQAPNPAAIGQGGVRGEVMSIERPLALFNLKEDSAELNDLSLEYPEQVVRLQEIAEQARLELGDSVTGVEGREIRKVGQAEVD
jgi:arylsulfatase A